MRKVVERTAERREQMKERWRIRMGMSQKKNQHMAKGQMYMEILYRGKKDVRSGTSCRRIPHMTTRLAQKGAI